MSNTFLRALFFIALGALSFSPTLTAGPKTARDDNPGAQKLISSAGPAETAAPAAAAAAGSAVRPVTVVPQATSVAAAAGPAEQTERTPLQAAGSDSSGSNCVSWAIGLGRCLIWGPIANDRAAGRVRAYYDNYSNNPHMTVQPLICCYYKGIHCCLPERVTNTRENRPRLKCCYYCFLSSVACATPAITTAALGYSYTCMGCPIALSVLNTLWWACGLACCGTNAPDKPWPIRSIEQSQEGARNLPSILQRQREEERRERREAKEAIAAREALLKALAEERGRR